MILASRCALVIVDLQNDFLHPQGAYARGQMTNPAALLLPDLLLGAAGHVKKSGGMVASSHFTLWPDQQGEPMISPHLKKLRPFLKRGDFAPGSWGQQDVEVLSPVIDFSVCKVAYSAFFNTQLDWVLRRAGVQTVVVAGIVTNGGVASTVRDAHMRDYHTIVLSDGCAAFSEQAHQNALADMATIAEVKTCQQLRDTLITSQ